MDVEMKELRKDMDVKMKELGKDMEVKIDEKTKNLESTINFRFEVVESKFEVVNSQLVTLKMLLDRCISFIDKVVLETTIFEKT